MDITEIFTNPLVWGLLAWLFSKFFTSKGKEEQNKSKPSNQRPKSPQEPRSNPRPRPVPKPVMTTVETKQREERKRPLQSVQEAYEKMKLQPVKEEKVEIKERPKRIQPIKEERLPKVNRNVNRNDLIIDRQKAAQGVIWSEILGAPRAKKPHFTQKRRHL